MMHQTKVNNLCFLVFAVIIYCITSVLSLDKDPAQFHNNSGLESDQKNKKSDRRHLVFLDDGHKHDDTRSATDLYAARGKHIKPKQNRLPKEFDQDALCMNLYRENYKDNQVCSSLSALLPIGKLALGAKGKTLSEILKLLHLKHRSQVEGMFSKWIQKLKLVKYNTLDLAANIFVDIVFPIKKEFTGAALQVFNSTVLHIDLTGNGHHAAKVINNWVKNYTHGEITELIKPEDINHSSIVIVNALYFKGAWQTPFDSTSEGHFRTPFGIKKCDMMKSVDRYAYAQSKSLDSQILRLPFRNEELSLYVVLPNKINGLESLLNKLKENPKLIMDAAHPLRQSNVNVSLPKFEIESTIQMNELFKNEGLLEMFESEADFSVMTSRAVHVSKIVQKTILQIDEKGAKFAGATGVIMEPESNFELEGPSHIFKADHPFLYFLEIDDVILLSGILNSPSK